MHPSPNPIWALPFLTILGAIAILPLVHRTAHAWEKNSNKFLLSLVLSVITLAYYGTRSTGFHHAAPGAASVAAVLEHAVVEDYIPFVILLFALYVAAGGLLTPIGDPPLFLGYLQGVPFLWTLRLFPYWLGCILTLLAVYWVWDSLVYRTEPYRALVADRVRQTKPKIRGQVNFPILFAMILCVALLVPGRNLAGWVVPDHSREVALILLAIVSLALTPKAVRVDNQFNYGAILEVAALFLGIFITMQVPMEILKAKGPSLGLEHPVEFFWASGVLSSFLDNAPTYLVFLETAKTLPLAEGVEQLKLISGDVAASLLAAISLGSVLMGANTYIGNGPNFMVKSIAEQSGVKMPSFFGYMAYSVGILIPIFIVISLIGL